MSTLPPSRWRHRLVLVLLALAFGAVSYRLVELQVVYHDRIVARADSHFEKTAKIPGPRGEIVDRHGRVLAMSVPTEKIFVVPNKLERHQLELLERATKRPRRLTSAPESAWRELESDCNQACQEKIADLVSSGKIPKDAIVRSPSYRRHYPLRETASPLLGFVSFDEKIKEGIERRYDELLRATVRVVTRMQDARGGAFDHPVAPPLPNESSSLMLTIDLRLQRMLEQELLASMKHHGARSADGVILDPWTGEVLAMASLPHFDPNRYNRSSKEERRNGAILRPFQPGSVVKPLVAAGLVERGYYSASRHVDCEQGAWRARGRTITDVKPYGSLTLPQVLQVSSNIGMTKFARSLKARELHTTFRAFGLGQKTGIDLPAESPGKLHPYEDWKAVDQDSLAFGYYLEVTPLQLARAYATIASGGIRPEISIARAAGSPDGVWHRYGLGKGRRAISLRTAETLTRWLEDVVEGERATGSAAAIHGYSVAGKTGTARVLDTRIKDYLPGLHRATFAGFAPTENPAAVVVVTFDRTRRNGTGGGAVAAPCFSRVMAETLRLLRVPPSDLRLAEATNALGDQG